MKRINRASVACSFSLLLVLLVGCVPPIITNHDDFDKTTISRGQGVEVKADSGIAAFFNTTHLNLAPVKITPDNGQAAFYLDADLWNADWLFIGGDRPLSLIIDGTVLKLGSVNNSDSIRSIITGNLIREQARYSTDLETLNKIVYSKTMRVRLEGRDSRFDGSIPNEEKEKLYNFLVEAEKK